MGRNIPSGNFPGGFSRGRLIGGNFPGGNILRGDFPRTLSFNLDNESSFFFEEEGKKMDENDTLLM